MKNKFISDDDIKKKFGVNSEKVIDVQALAGDSSDNVPGVPGIGVKTAAELINQYGTIENLLKNTENIKHNKRRETLIENKDKAILSKRLVTLKKDVLDPQGKVIHQTLDGMGFKNVNEVRQGKYFEIDVKESDPIKAKNVVEDMCKKLLANLVIENYKIIETQ